MPPCDIYARVFENAQTGLLLLERDTGRILEVNAAFLRMAGRGCTEVVGRSFWAPPLVADVDAGAEIHGHLLAGGTVTGAELPLQAGDGRRLLLEVSGSAASGLIQLEVRDATGREQERLAERFEMLRLLARRTAAEFHNLHRVLRTTGELLLVGGAGQGRPVPGELDFNGFWGYVIAHSKYKPGVYSAAGIWTSIFGTGSAASIPHTDEWTYEPETANLSDAPSGWCLKSGGCAQFFGGVSSSSSNALMWQWSGGGGVRNAIGDFDQIDASRQR